MTPSFANKATRRYYYYKCYKVVRDSRACSLKGVNSERVEAFLIENLSRIAYDKQYINNMAFKIAYETGGLKGFELPSAWPQNLATRISQVLIDFKNKIQNANQIEKCLIFQKTIQGIKFSRHELEVIVNIKDTNEIVLGNSLGGQLGNSSGGMRAGAANLTTPACSGSLTSKLG